MLTVVCASIVMLLLGIAVYLFAQRALQESHDMFDE